MLLTLEVIEDGSGGVSVAVFAGVGGAIVAVVAMILIVILLIVAVWRKHRSHTCKWAYFT